MNPRVWTCPRCGEDLIIADGFDIHHHDVFCRPFSEFTKKIKGGSKRVRQELSDGSFVTYTGRGKK